MLDSELDLVTGPRDQETHPIDPEQLRVFPTDADIPKDELNTTIDQYFVPLADSESSVKGDAEIWKSKLVRELRKVS